MQDGSRCFVNWADVSIFNGNALFRRLRKTCTGLTIAAGVGGWVWLVWWGGGR
jgi:hypothetical protein